MPSSICVWWLERFPKFPSHLSRPKTEIWVQIKPETKACGNSGTGPLCGEICSTYGVSTKVRPRVASVTEIAADATGHGRNQPQSSAIGLAREAGERETDSRVSLGSRRTSPHRRHPGALIRVMWSRAASPQFQFARRPLFFFFFSHLACERRLAGRNLRQCDWHPTGAVCVWCATCDSHILFRASHLLLLRLMSSRGGLFPVREVWINLGIFSKGDWPMGIPSMVM